MKANKALDETGLFSSMPQEDQDFLARSALRRTCPRGQLIHSPGDRGDVINYLESGRVKVYNLSACGKEIIYRFCQPGSFFGIAEIFGGEEREVFAEAVEDCIVLAIERSHFEQLIRRNPGIAILVIGILGSRIRQAHQAIKHFVVCDVRSRLAQLLIKLAQLNGSPAPDGGIALQHKFTHQEMANMIGAIRQTVTEIINEFKKQGHIRCDHGKIVLVKPDALSRLIVD